MVDFYGINVRRYMYIYIHIYIYTSSMDPSWECWQVLCFPRDLMAVYHPSRVGCAHHFEHLKAPPKPPEMTLKLPETSFVCRA